MGIEPHDKADELAKKKSKDVKSKPVSTTMDFFAHKSRIAREANRKLFGKIMEGSARAKPLIKRVNYRRPESGSIPQGHAERIRNKDNPNYFSEDIRRASWLVGNPVVFGHRPCTDPSLYINCVLRFLSGEVLQRTQDSCAYSYLFTLSKNKKGKNAQNEEK